ncbi:MAG: type I-G CRISPR-associated RAMP protein Csb1/Cas7g [Halothiobacillaceae bacterium]
MYQQDRVLITATLELTNGRFLQPTGFPDIGPCIYRDKDGRRWCLVESEQSMANRLEAVCMKDPGVWVDDLKGLPLIAVRNPQRDLLTTNLCEPHRVASSYILEGKLNSNKTVKEKLEDKLGLKNGGASWPLGKRHVLNGLILGLDPSALLHGFQFVQWEFVGLRQTRLLHGRLEAELAEDPEVHYGMVKWDAIEPESTREKKANKGQSMAVKSRIVPRDIIATFEIDMLGLRSLALDDEQKKFLLGLALWKIGAFLANKPSFDPRSRQTLPSLRLRADCYLHCKTVRWSGDTEVGDLRPEALMQPLPAPPDFWMLISEELGMDGQNSPHGTEEAGTGDRLYEGPLVEVTYEPREKKPKTRAPASREADESEEDEPSEKE